MSATSPLTPDAQKKADSRRKRKAILAGGVVLGLGAAVTLAAWSDDVFADGLFNTGTFNMQGNASTAMDTGAWEEYDSADGTGNDGPATLSFRQALSNAANPTTLQANETVWAPLSVRLDAATDTPGTFVLTSAAFGNEDPESALTNGTALQYSVYTGVDAADCIATAATATPGGTAWYTQTPVGDIAADVTATGLTVGSNDEAGTAVNMCLGVTLTSNDQQYMGAEPVSVIWNFTATADTP